MPDITLHQLAAVVHQTRNAQRIAALQKAVLVRSGSKNAQLNAGRAIMAATAHEKKLDELVERVLVGEEVAG